jgi:hypothetical protein
VIIVELDVHRAEAQVVAMRERVRETLAEGRVRVGGDPDADHPQHELLLAVPHPEALLELVEDAQERPAGRSR